MVNKARDFLKLEMSQLHLQNMLYPRHQSNLNNKEKSEVLESCMFIKLNRYGNIKVRTVGGRNREREFISEEDVSSPTLAIEEVLRICVIYSHEDRYVAIIDIPNYFILKKVEKQEDMFTIIVRGYLVNVMLKIYQEVYKSYVINDKKCSKILISILPNTIYVTMVSSLLYNWKICKTLLVAGFKLNPYDTCVANWMVNVKQQTIFWHEDD